MNRYKSLGVIIAICLVVLVNQNTFAQLDGIGFDDATDIDEAVPINGLVYIAMAVAGLIGYKKIKKEK